MAQAIPAHATAKEILSGVSAKTYTRAAAVKFLKARLDAAVASGRVPRFASIKAYEKLTAKFYEYDRAKVATRKQRRNANADTAKPKAAKRKTTAKKAKPSADNVSVADLVAQLGEQLAGAPEADVVATFTSIAEAAVAAAKK